MKGQKRNNLHISSRYNKEEQEEVIENQYLPNIVLPISTLPKFNFATSTPVPNTTVSGPVTSGSPGFIFLAPIQYSVPSTLSGAHSSQEDKKFTFSSPVILDNSTTTPESPSKKQKVHDFSCPTVPSSSGISFTSIVSVESSEGFKKSQSDSTAGSGIKPASDLIVGGSVMDVLVKTKTSIPADKPVIDLTVESTSVNIEEKCKQVHANISPSSTSRQASDKLQAENPLQEKQGFGEKFKPDPGSWECSVCMLRNKSEDLKCVACENPKLGAGSLTQNSAGFGDKFKPPPGSWPCPTCMINNKSSVSRCAACETPKPGSLSQASKGTVSGFSEKFKPAVGSWECDTCLIRNKADSLRCVACETPRASEMNATEKKDTFSGFKFGASVSSSSSASNFKFVSPSNSGNVNTTSKCSFNFCAPTILPASSTAQQSSFSFGAPVTTTSCTTTEFKFGVPITTTSCATTEFKFGVPVTTTSCTTTEFKFGIPSSNKEISISSGIHNTQESVSSKTKSTDETITLNSSKSTDAASEDKTSASGLMVTSVSTQQTKLSFGLPVQATVSGLGSQAKQLEFDGCINKEDKKAIGGFSFPLNRLSTQDSIALSKPEEKPKSGFSFGVPSEKKKENTSLVFSSTKKENLLVTSTTPVAPSFGFLDKSSTSMTFSGTGSSSVPNVPVFTMNTEKKDAGGSGGANFFFGNSSGMNSTSKPATFSFGTSTTSSVFFGSTASPNLFTFGSQGPATLAFGGGSSSGAPTFGSATPKLGTIDSARTPAFGAVSSVPKLGATFPSEKPAFRHESSETPSKIQAGAPPFGTVSSVPKLGATFPSEKPAFRHESSETPSKVQAGAPTFGVALPACEASSNVPLFGQPQPESKPSLSNNNTSGFNVNSTPTFQFGLSSSAQPSGVFRFGTPQVPGASTQETTPFAFGSPAQHAVSVAPTSSFFNSNVTPFGFSTPTPSFQPTSSSENPFSVSVNNKNPPRKFRRAVRRTTARKQ
ncbi:nuclear pore complex protein Nup153-like isoform X2 [Limulus polyphemus]|uniref:Nuclear pore complex protein Nup153 n=1 Tax=Limulus polyphemus TaxID=6850 RepID=A0ABM1BZT7_LIMPO|nr:nuclear pore complex protein Nup153-like isoform X2 [Limulus polyphemus]XP_022235392.1 nuclear pore complex protein Nup153-like isoform X2 [Limulus polyphemus]